MRSHSGQVEVASAAVPMAAALALAAVAAALPSLVKPDLLLGEPVIVGNLRGTALAVLALGVPALLVGTWATVRRGTAVGLVVWLAAAAYLTYQGVMFCFATPMNPLFLAYVALLGSGIWTLLVLWPAVRPAAAVWRAAAADTHVPFRGVAVFIGVVAALNVVAWLARVLPVMRSGEPASDVVASGLTTSPVLVQDLAFWLPAAIVVAVACWHRIPTAFLAAGGVLGYWVLEGLTVASDQWWGARADASHPDLAAVAVVPGALIVSIVVVVPFALVCRTLGRVAQNDRRAGAA